MNDKFWSYADGRWQCAAGTSIDRAIRSAIECATKRDGEFVFDFNGVRVTVDANSDEFLIRRDWDRAISGYINKTVGPNPVGRLSSAQLASDARVESENERRRADAEASFAHAQQERRRQLDAALAEAPPISLRDEGTFRAAVANNTDPYGAAAVRFAENWARLMQSRIAAGERIVDCASTTSHVADCEGITGFMYGCAVGLLAKVWEHGEELRQWHNLATQLRDEGERANESGGILNPALLTISHGDKP